MTQESFKGLMLTIAMTFSTIFASVSVSELNSLEHQLKELHEITGLHGHPDKESCIVTSEGKKLLNELLEDFKNYTIPLQFVSLPISGSPPHYLALQHEMTSRYISIEQEGTLYHHTIWTAHALQNWFAENNYWVKEIDPKDKNLTILIGLLHDIWHTEPITKRTPANAFLYLIESPMYVQWPNWYPRKFGIENLYKSKDGAPFSFTKLRKAFHISESDWFIIAITAALVPFWKDQPMDTTEHEKDFFMPSLDRYGQLFRDKFNVEPARYNKRFYNIYRAVGAAHALATREVILTAPPGDFELSRLKSPEKEKPAGASLFTQMKLRKS